MVTILFSVEKGKGVTSPNCPYQQKGQVEGSTLIFDAMFLTSLIGKCLKQYFHHIKPLRECKCIIFAVIYMHCLAHFTFCCYAILWCSIESSCLVANLLYTHSMQLITDTAAWFIQRRLLVPSLLQWPTCGNDMFSLQSDHLLISEIHVGKCIRYAQYCCSNINLATMLT